MVSRFKIQYGQLYVLKILKYKSIDRYLSVLYDIFLPLPTNIYIRFCRLHSKEMIPVFLLGIYAMVVYPVSLIPSE